MTEVLIVGVGQHRDFGFRSLRDADCGISVVDEWEAIPVEWCDWYAGTSTASVDQICDLVESSGRRFDALLCWNELKVGLAHEVGRRLNITTARLQPSLFRDKVLMHLRLKRLGIPSAFIGAASTLQECRDIARQENSAVVIKPADYGGSDGVQMAVTEEEVTTAYQTAIQRSLSGRVVIDRFIPGPEVSVECISVKPGEHHVLAITEKLVSSPPYFVELGHLVPALLSAAQRREIEGITQDALTALDMQCGISHSEVKLGPNGPVMIETAGRQAGDMIPKLVHLATGVNPYLLELGQIQGYAPMGQGTAQSASCVRFFGSAEAYPVVYPPVQEQLSARGLGHLIVEISYWYPEGIRPLPRRGNGSRFGYCLLSGSTEQVRRAYQAMSAIVS